MSYLQDCFIDYEKSASNTTTTVCSKKLVKDCGGQEDEDDRAGYGRDIGAGTSDSDIICSTYYQSECVTSQEEHQVILIIH